MCAEARRRRSECGQASVEWIALVALVALLLGAIASATGTLGAAASVPKAVVERLVCAVRLSENCREQPKLERAYDDELVALLQAHAPTLLYEPGMRALPVDYRRCRSDGCAEGGEDGHQTRTNEGEPVTTFTHVIDCRQGRAARAEAAGADCSGPRRGNTYLQYWFYYQIGRASCRE